MSRFERVSLARAAHNPTPGMRLYGRGPRGHLIVVRVAAVERGCVYYGKLIRGGKWDRRRMPLSDWAEDVTPPLAIAARVPK